MKMKLFLAIVIIALFSMKSFSQNDSLRNQILNYEQSRHVLLDKGRRLLVDHIVKSDMFKAKEVKDLLLNENDGNVYNTFYPIEYIYILYWTEEYAELIDFIKQVDFRHPVSNSVNILAQTDNMFSTLFHKTAENKDLILVYIEGSDVSEMDKEFLVLQLEDILRAGQSDDRIDFESEQTAYINELSDSFLGKYPDSPYETIIRETIRFKFRPSPWAMYWDFFGLGVVVPTNNLSDYISTGAGMEMAFDVRYKKLVGIFGLGFSGHTLNKDININNVVWQNGSSATLGVGYLNAGYLLHDTKRFSIYPFVGGGYSGFSTAQNVYKDIPELKNLKFNSWFPQAGIGFDYKFNISMPNYYTIGSQQDNWSRISIRYTYRMPNFSRSLEGRGDLSQPMDGFTHNIMISWGLGGRSTQRVK